MKPNHPPTRRLAAWAAITMLLATGPIGSALADTKISAGNVTGSDVTAPGAAPAMTRQALDKVNATEKWAASVKRGDTAAATKAVSDYTSQYGGARTGVPAADLAPTAQAWDSSAYLGLTQVGQNKGYYCGPATGYMVVRYLHGAGFTSRYDGSQPGQAGLANANHMRTDINGGTSWSSGLFVTGINRWNGDSYYVQVNRPSASLTKNAILYSIDYWRKPLAADTVEVVNGAHYNGHPNRLIGHWIAGYGYSSTGDVSYWADPSTTVFPNASPTFSYNTAAFANSFLQSNGIVY